MCMKYMLYLINLLNCYVRNGHSHRIIYLCTSMTTLTSNIRLIWFSRIRNFPFRHMDVMHIQHVFPFFKKKTTGSDLRFANWIWHKKEIAVCLKPTTPRNGIITWGTVVPKVPKVLLCYIGTTNQSYTFDHVISNNNTLREVFFVLCLAPYYLVFTLEIVIQKYC